MSGAHTGGISKAQVRAMERAGEPPKCGYCHKAGHWNHNGPTGAKAGGCPDKYPCSICNASDHCGRQHRRQACSKPPVSEGFATPVSRPSSPSASSPPPSPRMQVVNAEISPATGSVEQGEHSDPLGVRAEERVPSQLCARAAEVVKACRDDLRKLEQEQLARSAGNVQGDEQSAQQGERSAAEVHLQADVPTEAAKKSAPDLSAERGADQDQSGRPEADRQERSLQQEESLLGSEKGVRPALPDGAALHGARPKGWIDKFPAYAELKRNREAQDARDGKPRHQARRGRHALDDDDEFPYRGRPGCACCGDQRPVLLRRTEDIYSSMTGPPDRDCYRNVQVCLLCIIDNPKYKEMFPVARILRQATKADIIKLAKKFSNADDTEGAQDKFLSYMQPYTQGAFECQKLKNENLTFKRASEALVRSEVFMAKVKAGRV